MSILQFQGIPYVIAGGGVVVGQTTLTINNFYDSDGNPGTMASFGTKGYGTVQPNALGFEEAITFTGVTDNGDGTWTLIGVSNQLAQSPYTETSGFVRSHPGASNFIISNTAGFYQEYAHKSNTETITGKWTVPGGANRPILSSDTDATINEELVDFGQLSRTSFAGTVNASLTVKGIVEIATTAEINADATVGATGASVVTRPDQLVASKYGLQLPSVGEKQALVGTAGTPSSSNKFVTNNDTTGTGLVTRASATPAFTDVQIFTAGGTWTKPAGAKSVEVVVIGAGGGGGSGRKGTAANQRDGGGGGGGGAVSLGRFNATVLGTTETITVGAAGTGGAAQTTNTTNGNPGVAGGFSSFGSWLKAGGGGAGAGGTASSAAGGGGGSSLNSGSGATGGAPTVATGTDAIALQSSTASTGAAAGNSSEYGGASGGAPNASVGLGGSSVYAGPGGGGGGSVDASDNVTGGFAGGTVQAYTAGGGGAGGAANTAGTAGSTNTVLTKGYAGSAGGGGGGSKTTNGGGGGNGGAPAAGGGGGGAVLNTSGNSGAGGDGGRGEVRVYTFF